MKYDSRVNGLFSTITDLSHARNINRLAFNDIGNVLLSFHDQPIEKDLKWVCDASMGHGKTTVLISYLKWITKQQTKQPILLAIKEKHLAYEIYKEVSKISHNSIINIDADNKDLYQSDLNKYQVIIIQHQRLKNFALNFGSIDKYTYYGQKEKIKRKLIIDEKPDFIDSVIFDINSINNVLDWFEDLAEPLNLTPIQIQKYKSYIMFLLSEQLADNLRDHTTSLFTNNDDKSIRGKNLLSIIEQMKTHEGNLNKYESLNKLKHFEKLLREDNYARIDDYEYNKIGRKIIVSKLIDYATLNMNLLVFDGTAKANALQYIISKFDWHRVENRNNYTRLHIHIDNINTTKYSRNKDNKSTQKAIAKRIRELYKIHNDLFILPTKEEIGIYINEYAIREEDKHLYYDDNTNHTKGINLLNTTGKNFLKDKTTLYLTCLPKRNADYYKCIAIAFYGDELSNLMTNSETDNGDWFRDRKLEMIYKHDLYAEILQIIHRSALRIIDSTQPINIYIAYDEEDKNSYNEFTFEPISINLNSRYLKGEAVLTPHYKILDPSLYGRDKKIEGFAELIKEKLSYSNELTVNNINQSFSNYIKKHWNNQQQYIINEFAVNGIEIFIDESDKRKTKRLRLIK